jgi:hypothetical protein
MVKELKVGNLVLEKASVVFWAILLGMVAMVIIFAFGPRPIHANSLPTAIQTSAEKYAVYSSGLKVNEVPWIFDGHRLAKGKVLAVWDADTEANRIACGSEWSALPGYRTLCIDISNQKILAVQHSDLKIHLVTYVPVSRIAKVRLGETVLIKMGEIAGNRVVHALPSFVRTLPDKTVLTRS